MIDTLEIPGGVTAAKGFKAAGVHCGIRRNASKKDLALILADVPCTAAAVYTTNRMQAAPIHVTRRHLQNGKARAIIANSGNANACAPDGEANALRVCHALAENIGIDTDDIIINSTGVIGQTLPVAVIEQAIPALVAGLHGNTDDNASLSGSDDAAHAIMTTDTVPKQTAVTFPLNGVDVTIGAIAKGSGMIHPNMATLLCFITTDCAIESDALHAALTQAVNVSFNRVSVDGDTSTNDMTAILASGLAGNTPVTKDNSDFNVFTEALKTVCVRMAKMIARDGEGAKKLITCRVSGAMEEASALQLSMSVTRSSLVKTAMTGADANCGRVLCALGYAGVDFDTAAVQVAFESDAGRIEVCANGLGLPFDEPTAKSILSCDHIMIDCVIGGGNEIKTSVETYGCDLTSEYVRINGDYRS